MCLSSLTLQGGARAGSAYSSQTSPALSSSSRYDTYGGTSTQGVANFGASATFGAERSGSYGGGATQIGGGVSGVGQGGMTQRREMEVEEHYENGRLVHGREEDKEWKNEQLLRHDHRRYGEVSTTMSQNIKYIVFIYKITFKSVEVKNFALVLIPYFFYYYLYTTYLKILRNISSEFNDFFIRFEIKMYGIYNSMFVSMPVKNDKQ